MTLHSSWVALTGQTRENTRLTQVGATTPANPLQARSGILPGSYDGQFRVSGFWMEGTSAMAATLNEGRAVIQGLSNQGAYPVTLDADLALTFADGDAVGNRIDLVVLRIYDGSYDTSGKYEAAVEIIRGTPSATPVAPAAPPLSLPLYKVSVPAGTSAGKGGINWGTALTDLRVPTVSVGGILPVIGEIAPGGYPGQYQDSNGSLQRWDGTAWVPYPSAMGGIAPKGTVTTASYVGQYRDTPQRVLQRWNGTAWLPAFPAPTFVESRDAGSTTSTTYTETLQGTAVTAVKTTFNAPTSGQVLLHFGARTTNVANNNAYGYTSVRVTQGATVIWEPDDERSALHHGDRASSVSTMLRLGSLSGDLPYTVTVMHRTSTAGVTTYFDSIFLRVDPLH
uniref:Minor tail protein n=1 Tax=Streptomyces sp. NBC_00049 TaxID=2903617 RepID=A0AAU2JRT1_9ACTN